jgi:hypothetical protein
MRMVEVVVVLGVFSIGACGTEAESLSKQRESSASDAPLRADRSREIAANIGKTRQERVDALRRVLGPRLDRSGQDLQPEQLLNGARAVKLERRFGHAAVARKRADGSLEQSCFNDADGATRFLAPQEQP